MQVHPISVSESSLLRSPIASQGEGGALGEEEARKRGNTVGIRDNAMDIAKLNGLKVSRVVDNLMPTPTTQDGKNNAGPSQFERNTKPLNVEAVLMGTPRTSSANGSSPKQVASDAPKARIEDQVLLIPTPDAYAGTRGGSSSPEWKKSRGSMVTLQDEAEKGTNWGKFEPAIRRWEEVLGRPAPAPTKPDGKEGAHRLSSAFTEWMMGVPEGWITDCGLTRNEELKACGNGVVPQQAELALRVLLEGVTLPNGGNL
jgi:DNA (cytosine-5)-methyltransferase 1